YTAASGDVIFCATSKDVALCAVTIKAPQGRANFIANQGKVGLTQATDERHIITNTKSIGISFGMSESVLHAMRGDFSQAMQSAVGELQVVKDVKGLLNAEGVIDNGIKGILAANSMVQSLVALNDKGLAGFLAGNLNNHFEIKFGKQHETINFSEIVGNWLLAKEIIVQSKKNVELEAIDLSCQDLSLTTTTANIEIDGGVVSNSSYSKSTGVTFGVNADSSIKFGVSSSRGSTQSTIHGISSFRVTGDAYISAIKGEVSFRNAILEARRAYIEALQLKLESSRDEVIEKMQSVSVGTDLKFNQSGVNSKWVQSQTGIRVSEDLYTAIAQSTALIGAFIEVGSNATPLIATKPEGDAQELYELLLPQDSNSGFKVLGIPRGQAILQLFEKAHDPKYREMLAPEIIQQLRLNNLPETITPEVPIELISREELLAWANTKECYENYLGFYLALESTQLPLSKHKDLGSMACIAKINNLQLDIWGKLEDDKLCWSMSHNDNGLDVINIATDIAGNYSRLSITPGMLISPAFNYSDVESSYDSKEVGLSVDKLVFGEMVSGVKLRDVRRRQINFAHLSDNLGLHSNDRRPAST
ncbi:MAG: hypothetical protein ACR2HS_05915, partial [Gammaproteobacteria bacterium]